MMTSLDLGSLFIAASLFLALIAVIALLLFVLLRRKTPSQGFPIDPRDQGRTK